MPGLPKPKPFPGVSRLPGPIRGLVEAIFPPDQVPLPEATVISGGQALGAPAKALIKLLREYRMGAQKALPNPEEIANIFANEKYMGRRIRQLPPVKTTIEGVEGPAKTGQLSPRNIARTKEQAESYSMLGKPRAAADPRMKNLATLPELRQIEMAPSMRGAERLEDAAVGGVRGGPVSRKPILQDGKARGGRYPESPKNSSLSDTQVRLLRKRLAAGEPVKALAKAYPDIRESVIQHIKRGETYRRVK